jgi:hypothetical protein
LRPRPSVWLERYIHARLIYDEAKLRELIAVGIKYDGDGIIRSMIPEGTDEAPYSTFGRHASVRLITPRGAVALGARLSPNAHGQAYVIGYDIAAGVWRLLHPITEDGPPSRDVKGDPVIKMRRDVAALRRYGY